ncbi:MAG TPA: EamA family transporter [Gaiellaceae bacterium]|nr:EamA family transporter [Gaiellaceae bacterium]
MPASAFGLALAAAFIHALWNVLLARRKDTQAATAVALVVAVVVFAPVTAATWDARAGVWPFVVVSSCLQLLYFVLLAAAYRRVSLSVVYPLARGAAPVLVLLIGVVALGKSSSWGQASGVVLVGAGILLVRGLQRDSEVGAVTFGLAIAATIAGYTLIDKHGITHASPISYLELTILMPAIVYASAIAKLKGLDALRAELQPSTFVAGVATFGAYALVLAALARASAASVAAVRETSVVIAALLAAAVLKERVSPARLLGAGCVAAGVALLSLT